MYPFILTMLCVFLLIPPLHAKEGKECIDWPKLFSRAIMERFPSGNRLIRLHLFKNGTGKVGDKWMRYGLPDLLARYLATDPGLTPLLEHHYRSVPAKRAGALQITGMFQTHKGALRVFVQLKDPSGKLLLQVPIEVPYPHHTRFFIGMREAAEKILGQIKSGKKINGKALTTIQNETKKVSAYENLSKGKQALEQSNRHRMEVALVWFQEAIREDRYYAQPYIQMMEAYGFISLYHKQKGDSYSHHLENVGATLNAMRKWARGQKPENRFLSAHAHYLAGSRALATNNLKKAAVELETSYQFVPEDPLTVYHLALTYSRTGDHQRATAFHARHRESNRCLGK